MAHSPENSRVSLQDIFVAQMNRDEQSHKEYIHHQDLEPKRFFVNLFTSTQEATYPTRAFLRPNPNTQNQDFTNFSKIDLVVPNAAPYSPDKFSEAKITGLDQWDEHEKEINVYGNWTFMGIAMGRPGVSQLNAFDFGFNNDNKGILLLGETFKHGRIAVQNPDLLAMVKKPLTFADDHKRTSLEVSPDLEKLLIVIEMDKLKLSASFLLLMGISTELSQDFGKKEN